MLHNMKFHHSDSLQRNHPFRTLTSHTYRRNKGKKKEKNTRMCRGANFTIKESGIHKPHTYGQYKHTYYMKWLCPRWE